MGGSLSRKIRRQLERLTTRMCMTKCGFTSDGGYNGEGRPAQVSGQRSGIVLTPGAGFITHTSPLSRPVATNTLPRRNNKLAEDFFSGSETGHSLLSTLFSSRFPPPTLILKVSKPRYRKQPSKSSARSNQRAECNGGSDCGLPHMRCINWEK